MGFVCIAYLSFLRFLLVCVYILLFTNLLLCTLGDWCVFQFSWSITCYSGNTSVSLLGYKEYHLRNWLSHIEWMHCHGNDYKYVYDVVYVDMLFGATTFVADLCVLDGSSKLKKKPPPSLLWLITFSSLIYILPLVIDFYLFYFARYLPLSTNLVFFTLQ